MDFPGRPASMRALPHGAEMAISPAHDDDTPRLSKRMAELGLCSRREADVWIARGWVRVDGAVVSELGTRVRRDQRVELDPKARADQDQLVTILLNKPVGFVSTQPEHGYREAIELIVPDRRDPQYRGPALRREHLRGLSVAGRLDIDSTGLLVLTQDGRIVRSLIGEDRTIEKEYLVRVQGYLDDRGLALLRHGLSLDGEPLLAAGVEWVNRDQLRFVLREGKKRQIRRMCEAVGLHVVGLKRIRVGQVKLGKLALGMWRFLGQDEQF